MNVDLTSESESENVQFILKLLFKNKPCFFYRYQKKKKSTGRFSMLTSVEAMAIVNHCNDSFTHLPVCYLYLFKNVSMQCVSITMEAV